MKYTDEQQKVIDLRNKNLIVSAAAGSGKTAVLTERIAAKICDSDNPASIDRMLIVTFTNAAAREMRERIGRKLREKLAEDPGNTHIRKQIAILHTAQITTIDSFCLFILKNHFEEIGFNPSFAVASENDLKQLGNEAFDETIEECFESGDEGFLDFVEMYAPNGKYGKLKELIFDLAAKADSFAYPYEKLESFRTNIESNVFDMDFVHFISDYENAFLKEALRFYSEAKALTEDSELTKHFDEACDKISLVEALIDGNFEYRNRVLSNIDRIEKIPLRYGSKKFDEEIKSAATNCLNNGWDVLKKLAKEFHYVDNSTFERLVKEGIYSSNLIIDFLIRYMKRYSDKKRDKGIIDFSDMEHLALDILVKNENGNLSPTETALAYRDYFDEVMIDEYQDSNDVQETLLSMISKKNENTGNRFMVGDIKQSIYGFRQAKPDIFRKKCETYSADESVRDVRINLSKNFRSREEVIDSVNYIFERCMIKEVGSVSYDKDEMLYVGNEDYPAANDNKTEVYCVFDDKETDEDSDGEVMEKGDKLSAVESEARLVAMRIKEMIESHKQVFDNDSKSMRDIRYSDIAILLRSTSGREVIFQNALKEAGIPAYVISKTGYYQATEVKLITGLLSVIDNPRQDLPLFGVMKSFIGGFSEEEIAKIRIISPRKRLLDSLNIYVQKGEDEELRARAELFVNEINGLRRESVYMSASEILQKILDKYDYERMVSSLPNGEQRLANIRLLIDTVDECEAQGQVSIHDFVKYLERITKTQVDMGEANILDENANVVRIMTIHKSKGLEYPVCFVSCMGTGFVVSKDRVMFDDDFGIGSQAFNLERRTMIDSPVKRAIAIKKKIEERGENLRVLYVALTRAKEKLIITGQLKKELEPKDKFGMIDLVSASNFMDIIYPIVQNESELFEIKKTDFEEADVYETVNETARYSLKKALEEIEPKSGFKEYQYSKESLEGMFVKTTVSELKKAAYLESENGENTLYHSEEKKTPKFVAEGEEEVGGSRRGSAYHRVMELMDFEHIYEGNMTENLRTHRRKMIDSLFIYEEDDELVSEGKIIGFLETDLSKRMSLAAKEGKLYLEQPFVLSVKASEVRSEFPEDEKILVQGVIDVYFEENGKLILMDYKTDRVDSAEELVRRYKTQLDYYSEALSRLEKKEVSEIYIYSFSLGEVIRIV